MMQPFLPSVLQQPNNNSLSMERALKQIRELLNDLPHGDEMYEDKVQNSIDDLDVMIAAIAR